MTNYPRVEVEWYDVEDDPRWQSLADAAASECPPCKTCGWLIASRDDTVVIAPTMNGSECSRVTIPRGCISGIFALKRGGKHAAKSKA